MQHFNNRKDIPKSAKRIDILDDGFDVYFADDEEVIEDKARVVGNVELHRKAQIKNKAAKKINAEIPMWRQLNLIISKLSLLEKYLGSSISKDDRDHISEINVQLGVIENIRKSSNQAEAQGVNAEDFIP